MQELCSFNHKSGYLSVYLRANGIFEASFFEWDDLAKQHRAGETLQGSWLAKRTALTLTCESGVFHYVRVKSPLIIGNRNFKADQYELRNIEAVSGNEQFWAADRQQLTLIDRTLLNKLMGKACISTRRARRRKTALIVSLFTCVGGIIWHIAPGAHYWWQNWHGFGFLERVISGS
jgi:hypothetical protein